MNKILRIAIPAPLYRYFDYLAPENCMIDKLAMGARILVPFGKRHMIGFLIEKSAKSDIPIKQLKSAITVLDQEALFPNKLIELIRWASDYYHYPLGEVFAAAIPNSLRKLRTERQQKKDQQILHAHSEINLAEKSGWEAKRLILNQPQQQAVDKIVYALNQFQVFLLNGVTGSGKTEVYLQAIAAVLKNNQQALVLVPEIGLTPQTVARFEERFNVPIVTFHSGLTERERLDHWLQAKVGIAKIIIGTRSAIFTPLLTPGIIIIDEEHDLSFKQQESFRYNARDLGIVRARLENIPVLLGSATPSLESFYNAQQKRYQILTLPERVGSAVHPQFHLIDLRNQKLENGLSPLLLQSMQRHLDNKGQVLLFLNRRGFAPILICQVCGWMADCKRCDAKMTLHKTPPYLQCHHCGSMQEVENHCPNCESTQLFPLGLGTQRLEQTLQQHFPNVDIVRIDRDSTRRKGNLDDMLQNIHDGKHQILIGTQMLAKGHHFPNVTLVAILDADSGLFSSDFRASERIAQLLIQVAGRAGRAEKPGEVLIQTYHPEHPLLLHLIKEGYESFTQHALQERFAARLPPQHYLALIRAEAINKEFPLQFLNAVKNLAQQMVKNEVSILGPVPSIMPRRAGKSRAQLLLQASHRNALHILLKHLVSKIPELPSTRRVRWSLDVDPMEMA